MAVIYLRHPKHGAKVAISDMEAENDMQNGWEEYDPADLVNDSAPVEDEVDDAPTPAPAPVAEPLIEPVNELQPRRRGRRPREATE